MDTKNNHPDYVQYADGGWQPVAGLLPEEAELPIFINGRELVSILCTPEKLNCLVIGFLASQGFITSPGDILTMRICEEERIADIRLKGEVRIPERRQLTSGCGAGIMFDPGEDLLPIESLCRFTAEQVLASTRMLLQLDQADSGDGRRRGVHTSALCDGEGLPVFAQDIGRHNTLDKIWGECLLRKIPTSDRLLVSTGRISSEMLIKAVRMRVPFVVSLNSATERAVALGTRFGVTVIGYARGSRFTIFCGHHRITNAASPAGLTLETS